MKRVVIVGVLATVTGVLTTVTGAVASVPPASRAGANVPATTPIKHVVVIYQENHSFDETLGAFCHATSPARCDGHTGPVTLQGGVVVNMVASPDVVPGIDHRVVAQTTAIDGGAMDGWGRVSGCLPSGGYRCLTYYVPGQIPNLSALATKFAVSDRTFSMADSPSWGGHLYAAAATLDGFTGNNPTPIPGVTAGPGWGCDSNKQMRWSPDNGVTPYRYEPSCVPKPDGTGAYASTPVPYVRTIFDALDAAGGTYHVYGQPTPATAATPGGYGWSICPSFAECRYGPQYNQLVPSANILTDAQSGTLPNFSILTPSTSAMKANGNAGATSQHNNTSMLVGDNWIGKVVRAIETGPDWNSTAIFITYDDCGCFYDHVAPGVNPDGTQQGIRVPMVVVSPYAKAGFTDSTPATFASILAFTEHTFGLTALGVNDAQAYDYSNAFDFSQPPITGPAMVTSTIPPRSAGLRESDNDPT